MQTPGAKKSATLGEYQARIENAIWRAWSQWNNSTQVERPTLVQVNLPKKHHLPLPELLAQGAIHHPLHPYWSAHLVRVAILKTQIKITYEITEVKND
jgi:hypothetical protein